MCPQPLTLKNVSDLWWDEEWDPGDHDKEAGGEVVGDEVVGEVASQDHLEPSNTEVTKLPVVQDPVDQSEESINYY